MYSVIVLPFDMKQADDRSTATYGVLLLVILAVVNYDIAFYKQSIWIHRSLLNSFVNPRFKDSLFMALI